MPGDFLPIGPDREITVPLLGLLTCCARALSAGVIKLVQSRWVHP
jgi:hypothetical protein